MHNHIKNTLSKNKLHKLLTKLNLKLSELVHRNELSFMVTSKLAVLTESEILQLMVDNPKLIESPIVELNSKTVLARPIELLEQFLPIEMNRIIRKWEQNTST